MPPEKPHDVGVVDALAFFVELAMFVLLLLTGHGLADGWVGWAIGTFLAVVAVGIWAQWMAPTSLRRLENPLRYLVQVIMFVTVGLYAAAGGLLVWGIAFAVIAIAVFGARVREDP